MTAGEDFIHSAHTFSSSLSQTSTSTARCPHSAKPQVCWKRRSHQSHSTLYWWADDTSEHPGYTFNMHQLLGINDNTDRMNKEHLSVSKCFLGCSSNSLDFLFTCSPDSADYFTEPACSCLGSLLCHLIQFRIQNLQVKANHKYAMSH